MHAAVFRGAVLLCVHIQDGGLREGPEQASDHGQHIVLDPADHQQDVFNFRSRNYN
jgi:hypothetical protein